MESNGYSQFKGSLIGNSALEVATKLGDIAHVAGAKVVQTLSPSESTQSEPSSYSGNYGTREFPFHTDMAHWYEPPRYLLLYCVTPSILVTTSVLLAAPLFSEENENDVRRSLFRPRRRLDGRLSPLRLHENNFYRWDTLFLRPLSNLSELLQKKIKQRISESVPHNIVLANTGDCLLIDNWKTFHARSAIPPEAMNREIERVYLSELKG